jgi:hypothetical protein
VLCQEQQQEMLSRDSNDDIVRLKHGSRPSDRQLYGLRGQPAHVVAAAFNQVGEAAWLLDELFVEM